MANARTWPLEGAIEVSHDTRRQRLPAIPEEPQSFSVLVQPLSFSVMWLLAVVICAGLRGS